MDLYAALGIERSATPEDVKLAYFRLAKKLHPDKNPKGGAQFMDVQKAYSVLRNPGHRKMYDERGSMPVEVVEPPSYANISREDLKTFEREYRGSRREREDVLRLFEELGSVELVLKHVMFARPCDKKRFLVMRDDDDLGRNSRAKKC